VSITNLTIICVFVYRKLDVIKETDGLVKEEPGPAAAVKTEPVCPSSGSLFELPTARESIKKIHTFDHIFNRFITPEEFSDIEGEYKLND